MSTKYTIEMGCTIWTYFWENCWVHQESWFPKITALGNWRSATLWTRSTFSLPKSPISRRGKEKKNNRRQRKINKVRFKKFTSNVVNTQSEWLAMVHALSWFSMYQIYEHEYCLYAIRYPKKTCNVLHSHILFRCFLYIKLTN